MEPSQGKKAVEEKDNFLLCVVPIPKGSETDIETVRENMRFVANIGDKVASLCDDLKDLEEFREDITADTPSGVRLDVEKTKAGILIKESVWKKHGFSLEKLIEHLMTNKQRPHHVRDSDILLGFVGDYYVDNYILQKACYVILHKIEARGFTNHLGVTDDGYSDTVRI